MNPDQRIVAALGRITALSSASRQRQAEARRAALRGDEGLAERLESIASRFEDLAKEMEKALS